MAEALRFATVKARFSQLVDRVHRQYNQITVTQLQ